MTNSHKSGFVTLIGKPNVGKSTLINTIIQEKITIVTDKPNTTRNQIRGIYNDDNHQIVFMDNPGISKLKKVLTKEMNKVSLKSTRGVDVILLLIDARSGIKDEDEFIIKQLKPLKDTKLIIGITKVDLIKKEKLIPLIKRLEEELKHYREIIPINTQNNKDGKRILEVVKRLMPLHPPYYDKEDSVDRSSKFLMSEIIREKSLKALYQEVPHSIFVEVTNLKDNMKKNVITLSADIYVERDSQKKVVIGKGGAMLKRIGISSRKEIEEQYDAKVFIELFVKVKNKWTEDNKFITDYGVVN